jgi:uncharacterized protein YbbC (DUF1343 family)
VARITGYNESMMAERRVTARDGEVKVGIDVLEADDFRELHPDPAHPVRIGLVTNQTALDAHGKRTADVLAHAPGIKLAAIFSPEHGIAGVLDTTAIGNSRDAATGVPVYSVYGDSDAKRRPTDEALAGVDAIVYDIQDMGARFYTYESTLGYFLEAAAKSGKEIVVLDRPNPIGGAYVQGRCGTRIVRQLLADSSSPRDDGGRTGALVQQRAGDRRKTLCGAHGRLVARRPVRFHRQSVDQSLSQHAQPDGSRTLSRHRDDRGLEHLGGPRHRHTV